MESPRYEMTHDFEEVNGLFQSGYVKGYHDAVMRYPEEATHWISVKDMLPNSGHVLARCEIRGLYKPKGYTCVALYAKKNSISVGDYPDDEVYCEYDEKTDEYYLKEGWYEVIHNWDEFSSVAIDDFVTHWMPLPEPPKNEEE